VRKTEGTVDDSRGNTGERGQTVSSRRGASESGTAGHASGLLNLKDTESDLERTAPSCPYREAGAHPG